MEYFVGITDPNANPNTNIINIRNTQKPLECHCGKTIFISLKANQYSSTPTDLFNGCKPLMPDHHVQILECVSCGKRMLPPTGYGVGYIEDENLSKFMRDVVERYNKRLPKDEP